MRAIDLSHRAMEKVIASRLYKQRWLEISEHLRMFILINLLCTENVFQPKNLN